MVFAYYGIQPALYTVNTTINLKRNSDFFFFYGHTGFPLSKITHTIFSPK